MMDRLSPEVRLQIYQHASLRYRRPIILNPDKAWKESCWPNLPPLQVYCSLIRVCRYISQEVVQAFYSQNRFALRTLHASDFSILHTLRPSTVRNLTYLTIHLNTTSCLKTCKKFWPRPEGWEPSPLGLDEIERANLLPVWKSTISRLLGLIRPAQLTLEVVCDCKDLATAQEAVAPLLGQDYPALRKCAVRLARWPDTALRSLAEYTALSATRTLPPRSMPFRFFDLPREIRLRILHFTDLVTPLSEVTWSSTEGFGLVYGFDECPVDCLKGRREAYFEFPQDYNQSLSDIKVKYDHDGNPLHCSERTHYACRFRMDRARRAYSGCFCRRYHAAWPILCQCSLSPSPLFLVSHAFREDALIVLYKSNRLVQVLPDRTIKAAKSTPLRVDADIFLSNVLKASALRNVRFLDLTFPPFDYDYMRPHEPAYHSWVQTIARIKEHLSLSALTLRVHMSDHWPNGTGVTRFRVNMTPQQADIVIEAYQRILMPLRQLEGLWRLFLHLAWPETWTKDQTDRAQYDEILGKMAALEQRFEKDIMGHEYDSYAAGKQVASKNEWLKGIEASSSLVGGIYPED